MPQEPSSGPQGPLALALRGLASFAKASMERLQPLLLSLGMLTSRALGRSARFASTHRRGLGSLGLRLAWWATLGLTLVVGRDLLGGFASDDALERAPYLLGLGFLACALVALLGQAKHLRAGAVLLGSTAGALGLLAWMTQQG